MKASKSSETESKTMNATEQSRQGAAMGDRSVLQEQVDRSPRVVAESERIDALTGSTAKQMKPEDAAQRSENKTGLPDNVKGKMERSFNQDFSDVRVHPNSSKAPEVGAVAFTQGSDVHFAPGQFSPNSTSGQQLIGHELTHVVQQREGRVKPTIEVGGMSVNDSPKLEKEADDMGSKA